MSVKLVSIAMAAAFAVAFSASAEANGPCLDPYGCEEGWRWRWLRYPEILPYDRYWDTHTSGYYDLPLYGGRVGHRCYYDHEWTNVVRVCY